MKEQKIITWKDADRNLCALAAAMFHLASEELRDHRPLDKDYPLTNGKMLDGFLATEENKSPFTGRAPHDKKPADYDHEKAIEKWNELLGLPLKYANDVWIERTHSELCWYSFQNLIRQRLKMARQELYDALYGQSREQRTSKQHTRNPNGRKKGSKFGWSAE